MLNTGTPLGDTVAASEGSGVPIDTMTLSSGDSAYIFAAVMRGSAATATYKPTGISSDFITVLRENRTINPSCGQSSDNSSGYEVQIYTIN